MHQRRMRIGRPNSSIDDAKNHQLFLHLLLFMMPPISHISLFYAFHFFFLNFMKCHYFWSKFSILFFTECFTFYYGHSFFSLTLSTMINKINLFKLYLHSYCTCDAIMTSKVKLDITTTIFFISCARFCFHSKGVVVCFIFSIYFVVGCFIFLVILSFIHHFSRCYCVRFAVLCSHGTVGSTGKWRRIKYNQMNRSK